MRQIFTKFYIYIIFVYSFLTIAGNSYIFAEDIEPQKESVEPILTEETMPNDVGEWDLRFTIDYFKHNEEINAELPNILLFFGLIENLGAEFSLPLNYRSAETDDFGLGSISTSIKWLFNNQSDYFPALVLGVEIGFPTNSFMEEAEENSYEISPYIAFLKDFGKLCIQGNIAGTTEIPVSGGENNYMTEFNLAIIYPAIEEKLFLLAELNSSFIKKDQKIIYIAPGIKYHLNESDCLAFAVPVELENSNSDLRFIIQYQLQL